MIAPATITTLPALRALWPGQGGHFAGLLPGIADPAELDVLIVSPAELGEFTGEWGKYGKTIKGADSYDDGRANTLAMAAAGSAIAKHVRSLEIEGHADYFIGSQADMHLCVATSKALFQQRVYWTSTQCSADDAWFQDFYDGSQRFDDKSAELRVRAVRRFALRTFGTLVFGGAA